jgi:hypothetical protein
VLSHNSPLGVRFHYLKGTTAEHEKFHRIATGRPGSPCTEKFLVSNTEFTQQPVCTASREYQRKKIGQLMSLELSSSELDAEMKKVLAKECLCTGLSNAAVKKYALSPFNKKTAAVNVCPGPNIAYFSKIVSLREMVDHIYGRTNVILRDGRPHMFIKELTLYIDYWIELLNEATDEFDNKRKKYAQEFHKNLIDGITYYRNLSEKFSSDWSTIKVKFLEGLNQAEEQLEEAIGRFAQKLMANA